MKTLIPTLVAFAIPLSALGLNPVIQKLHEPGSLPGSSTYFGETVVQSTDYLLVGEPEDQLYGPYSGAVHQFDARTGRYLRRLLPDAVPEAYFGIAIAISGGLIAVGAPDEDVVADRSGAVYVFDARTGQRLHKLRASDEAERDRFGNCVSLCGDWLVVGAPGDNNDRGAVYVFNARTGEEVHKLTASDGAALDRFGWSVALLGDMAFIGAIGDDGNKGSAYFFRPSTATQVSKLTASDGAASDQFGYSIALSGGLAAVGAHSHDPDGAVYVFDPTTGALVVKIVPDGAPLNGSFGRSIALDGGLLAVGNLRAVGFYRAATGARLQTIVSSDFQTGDNFGTSVSLCANRLLAGAPNDNDFSSGSAYLYRPVAGPLPLTSLAKVGDYAPGAIDIGYRSLGAAYIDPAGAVTFQASLTGLGSNRGRDSGIWTNSVRSGTPNPGPLRLLAKSREDGGDLSGFLIGKSMLGFRPAFSNQSRRVLVDTIVAPGANGRSSRAIIQEHPTTNTLPGLVGGGEGSLGARVAAFTEVTQTHSAAGGQALAYLLRPFPGVVDRTNDSGVAHYLDNADTGDNFREGDPITGGGGDAFRQFFGRVSHGGDSQMVYPAFVLPSGSAVPVARLLRDLSNVITAGAAVPGEGGALFSTPLGEASTQPFGAAVVRCTLSGPGVNRANNEMLWSQAFGKIARKGDPVPGEPAGVVWAGFLGFWPVQIDRVVFLAKLAGPGVGRANDCALYLWQENLTMLPLLREGEAVGTPDGARVAVITQVDVNPSTGRYLALAALTGDRSRNLAQFAGNADAGDATSRQARRLPTLRLRKGTLYSSGLGTATAIRSFILSPTTDRGGTGGRGLGQVIDENGRLVVTVQFDNRAVELMTGLP